MKLLLYLFVYVETLIFPSCAEGRTWMLTFVTSRLLLWLFQCLLMIMDKDLMPFLRAFIQCWILDSSEEHKTPIEDSNTLRRVPPLTVFRCFSCWGPELRTLLFWKPLIFWSQWVRFWDLRGNWNRSPVLVSKIDHGVGTCGRWPSKGWRIWRTAWKIFWEKLVPRKSSIIHALPQYLIIILYLALEITVGNKTAFMEIIKRGRRQKLYKKNIE